MLNSFKRFSSSAAAVVVAESRTIPAITTTASNAPKTFQLDKQNNSESNSKQKSSDSDAPVTFKYDRPLTTLSYNDPIVRRLFKPYIASDFESQGKDEDGKPLPPRIPRTELEWLHKHAYLFGLHPEKDLNLPTLGPHKNEPLDKRVEADLAFNEARRVRKLELRDKREEKRRLQLFKQKKISVDDLEELFERDERERQNMKLPLRFQTKEYREQMQENRVKTIGQLMEEMPRMIEEYRKRKQAYYTKQEENKKIF